MTIINSDWWLPVFIIWIIILAVINIFWGEQEWTIQGTSGCKVRIEKDNEWWNKIFTKYTCNYTRAQNWKIMWWTCRNADFNENWICMKLKSYKIEPEISCDETQNSYLHMGKWECITCQEWYAFNWYGDVCYKK